MPAAPPRCQMYKRILIATDLSECADAALRAGLRIAQREHAQVHLCTALGTPTAPMRLGAIVNAERNVGAETRQAERELTRCATQNGFASIPHELHVFENLPGDEIPRAAKRLGCDLIVICARGRSGSRRFVLGSVAERILGNSTVPVLVVPAHVNGRG